MNSRAASLKPHLLVWHRSFSDLLSNHISRPSRPSLAVAHFTLAACRSLHTVHVGRRNPRGSTVGTQEPQRASRRLRLRTPGPGVKVARDGRPAQRLTRALDPPGGGGWTVVQPAHVTSGQGFSGTAGPPRRAGAQRRERVRVSRSPPGARGRVAARRSAVVVLPVHCSHPLASRVWARFERPVTRRAANMSPIARTHVPFQTSTLSIKRLHVDTFDITPV